MLLDRAWGDSLLAAIAKCDTLTALGYLWKRWAADVAGSEWRQELIEAKDRRKEALRHG